MSFIDASTAANPLAAAAAAIPDDQDDEAQLEAEDEEPQRQGKPRKDSLLAELIDQVGDINIARRLDQPTLDWIGQTVVQEFVIDENSRKDWEQLAEDAMKFTLQKTEEKSFPWPRSSNVIYPLLGEAAVEFGARTYPAIVQGRRVVKGVIWGSDRGTPMKGADGQPMSMPPGTPSQQSVTPGPAPGGPGAQMMPGSGLAGPSAATMPGAPPGQLQQQPAWLIKPGEKRVRADRVGEHMSWQVLEEMPYWEEQTDQLLHQLPIIGGAAKKTFRDEVERCNASLFVSLMNLVWNYRAPSFDAAPRHTEKLLVYPHEITENENTGVDDDGEGMWLALMYGAEGTDTRYGFRDNDGDDASDPDAPHLFLEQHRRIDLDDDGYPEPYIVTVHRRSAKVVRIKARYKAKDIEASKDGDEIYRIKPTKHYTLIPYLPSIDGGSYPIGLGHLLKPLNEAINTTLNQMFDAGTLQNAGGGFIGEELGIASGQALFQVGKFIRVKTRGNDIRSSVFPIPFPGPSQTFFQLLGLLLEAGKQVAGIQNILVGDAAIANAPPTTVLALIEQGLKVYTAIIKRVFRALKSEFDKLYELNKEYITESTTFRVADDERDIEPDDYRLGGGVSLVADPKMVTDMQRLARAQILMQFNGDPLINQQEIRRRIFEGADIERIDDLFVPPDPMQAIMAQMAMAKEQAELGRVRAAELKDQTQAFLNLALARKNATGPEETQIDQQMTFMRQQIEAIDTMVRAANVDVQHHANILSAAVQHARTLAGVRQTNANIEAAAGGDESGPGSAAAEEPPLAMPTPAPRGAFPEATAQPPPGPDIVNAGSKGTGTPPADLAPPPAAPGPAAAPAPAAPAMLPGAPGGMGGQGPKNEMGLPDLEKPKPQGP